MKYLTLLNTIAILVILYKTEIIRVEIDKQKTWRNATLVGYDIWVNGFLIKIPLKNKKRIELAEEVEYLIGADHQERLQILAAKFSWLRTREEVRQFEKDYEGVDRKIVANLVAGFKPRQ